MYMGKKMPELLAHLKKEQYDIISMQEVSGGDVSFHKQNAFQQICDLGYDGQLVVTWRRPGDKQSFFGQAIFFKSTFTLLDSKEIWLKPYMEIPDNKNFDYTQFPKAVLSVTLEKEGKQFDVLSAHLAWSKRAIDTEEKMRQAKIFLEYMETVNKPYLLTGDFNLAPDTEIISWFDKLATNQGTKHNITNTINPRIHKAADELFPEGLVVDYVYTTPQITVDDFKVLENIDLSDHLGLSATGKI
jgi:endonuclease/exonuclease/phosphatase family metal-dependent hydrolase